MTFFCREAPPLFWLLLWIFPRQIRARMKTRVTPFLMFEGKAEEAVRFYISAVRDSHLVSLVRYGKDQAGKEGSVLRADFTIAVQRFVAIDSPAHHNFTFTPSMSLLIDCVEEAELDALFSRFSNGGSVMMPPECYGFSRKFAWVSDRYGVSWQLNLPHHKS